MDQAMLDFSVELPDGNLLVLGDEESIQRLFSILLENAGKFTPAGGSIKVRTTVEEHWVRFSVQDSGFGISAEHKPRIFDRFYRAAPNGGSPARGSGLGLALAKWIAERHGTELNVESERGVGSCFSFSLQRADHAYPFKDTLSTFHDASRRMLDTPSKRDEARESGALNHRS